MKFRTPTQHPVLRNSLRFLDQCQLQKLERVMNFFMTRSRDAFWYLEGGEFEPPYFSIIC
jgi:hypothetical protein